MTGTPVANVSSTLPRTKRARDRFYWGTALLLLLIALAGFARTFFLRGLFSQADPAFSPAHIAHGVFMTAWFVLLFTQASLIARGNQRLHTRLGIGGAVIGVGVLITAGLVIWRIPVYGGLAADLGFDPTRDEGLTMVSREFWSNAIGLFAIATLVLAALVLRKHREVHKRLMVFASIILVAPALDRIALWPIFGEPDFGDPGLGIRVAAFHFGGMLLLIAALIVHDLFERRRPHAATVLSFLYFFVVVGTATALAADSAPGIALVQWLSSTTAF